MTGRHFTAFCRVYQTVGPQTIHSHTVGPQTVRPQPVGSQTVWVFRLEIDYLEIVFNMSVGPQPVGPWKVYFGHRSVTGLGMNTSEHIFFGVVLPDLLRLYAFLHYCGLT